MVKIFLRVVLLGLLWVAGGVANAGDISSGVWYQFSFDTTRTTSASQSAGACDDTSCVASSNLATIFADAPAWTFTVGSDGATLKVTDAFYSGDSFAVMNFGGSLFATLPQNPVAYDDSDLNSILGVDCGDDPEICFRSPGMSFAQFALGAGNYSLTISVFESPAGLGSAYFQVVPNGTPIPTPGTLALTLLALFGLGWTQLKNRGAATNRRAPINLG